MPVFKDPPINFYLKTPVSLQERRKLKSFIKRMIKKAKLPLNYLNIVFCDDNFLLEINRTYLNHDYYTDIITFNLAEKGDSVEGEIYISVDRVRENAKLLSESFAKELHRVIFHGVLHLIGYSDNSNYQKKKMREIENSLLGRYFA